MANKLEQALEKIGKAFLKVFADTEKAAVIAEPFVDIAFPAIAPIYNATANGAAAALSAGKAAHDPTKSADQNLVAIVAAVEPVLTQYAQQAGLTPPTVATILKYAQAIQAALAAAAS